MVRLLALMLMVQLAFAQQVDDDDGGPTYAKVESSNRVFGVGLGVFLLAFFFVLTLLVCVATCIARPYGWYMVQILMVWIFGALLIILLVAERTPPKLTSSAGAAGAAGVAIEYSRIYVQRVVIVVLLSVTLLFAAQATMSQFVVLPIRAQPIEDDSSLDASIIARKNERSTWGTQAVAAMVLIMLVLTPFLMFTIPTDQALGTLIIVLMVTSPMLLGGLKV